MSNALFIFRRDLRVSDNTGLIEAVQNNTNVVTAFFFDPRQITSQNKYKSNTAINFMLQSLQNLEEQIKSAGGKIYFFFAKPEDTLPKIIKDLSIENVYINKDYTPFSISRDKEIQKVCNTLKVNLHISEDLLLTNPDAVKTKAGNFYSIFTPFYKSTAPLEIPKPKSLSKIAAIKAKPSSSIELKYAEEKLATEDISPIKGGTKEGLKILKNLSEFKNYAKTRDLPTIDTTHLSAHLKFGTISIRQTYHAIKDQKIPSLLKQLYWRDFFTYVAYHNPKVFKGPYKDIKIKWSASKSVFEKWCNGQTGFPIVDAGMRELNQTGFMHNRVRMVVSSFLVKDLHINWQWGEQYFAQKLVDYDPSVNNGNWQWSASTGTDAVPYFRIFNPWTQQKKFDAQAEYIKKWIPELKDISPKVIHTWYKSYDATIDYPKPIVNHDEARKTTLQMYKD